MRWVLRSKIHKATVIEADINYVGSISIDSSLMERVGMWPGEKVLISSITSGSRLETYIIPAKADSGMIGINGAAAHLIKPGEEIIIMGFELSDEPIDAAVILVDKQNKFIKNLAEENSAFLES